jgi:hypothetical protein
LSRGPWRIAAHIDMDGLVFYQTFTGVWPINPSVLPLICAVLNSPVANAYVATREGSDITNDTLLDIPVPNVSSASLNLLNQLIESYRSIVAIGPGFADATADKALRAIDAFVLSIYELPPKYERQLLDYFRRARRPIPFAFGDYFPADFKPCIPLGEYLSGYFGGATMGALRKRFRSPPEHILKAIRIGTGIESE